MSLVDDLKAAAHAIDPQFQISQNEVSGVVTSVLAYLEHGDDFLKAAEAGVDDVTQLLAPPPPEPEPTPAPAAEPAVLEHTEPAEPTSEDLSDEELDAMISDLQARKAARVATSQATVVEHETGPGPTEPS